MTPGLFGWLVIVVVGLAWEGYAIWRGDTRTWPTLSRLITQYAPKWMVAAALGWLTWHLLGVP